MKFRYLVIFIFLPFISLSQNTEIKVKLLNESTKKPVPFAVVYIDSTYVSTISNEAGEVDLRIPAAYAGKTMVVAGIGYQAYAFPLKKYTPGIEIKLKPVHINIQQVIAKEPVLTILQKALDKKGTLLYTGPVNYSVLMNDKETENGNIIYEAEAAAKIYKCEAKKQLGFKVQAARGHCFNRDYQRTYDNGFFVSLYNIHCKSELFTEAFFDKDHFKDYNYMLEGLKVFDNDSVYTIGFSGNKPGKDDVKGAVYIELYSLAIKAYMYKTSDNKHYENQAQAEYINAFYFKKLDNRWHLFNSFFGNNYKNGQHGGYYQSILSVYSVNIYNPELITPAQGYDIKEERNKFKYILTNFNDPFWKDYNFLKTRKF